jgi:hypothetical protein
MTDEWWKEKKFYHHGEWEGNDYVLFDKDDNEIDRIFSEGLVDDDAGDGGEFRQDAVDIFMKKAHYIQKR